MMLDLLQLPYGNETLVGSVHLPEQARDALVLLHGFTGNRGEFTYLFVDLARQLAAQGIAVFRFDFLGCGDSSGRFADLTLQSQIDQTHALLDALQARYPGLQWHLTGFSMGGVVAARVAQQRALASLQLIAPAANLHGILQGIWPLAHPLENGNVDWFGLEIGRALLDETATFDPLAGLDGLRLPVQVIHGALDATVPIDQGRRYADAIPAAQWLPLAGADHVFGRQTHRRALATALADFLRNAQRATL